MSSLAAGDQMSAESRQITGMSRFKGAVTYAGQHEGSDSKAAARAIVEGKVCTTHRHDQFGVDESFKECFINFMDVAETYHICHADGQACAGMS